jgi:hypothetical protein
MKKAVGNFFIALISVAVLSVAVFAQNSKDFLITNNSVGKVKLGMTVGQAKKIWKDYKFERARDGEFSALIAVKKGNRPLVTIHAEEKGYLDENSPIQDDARITAMEVWDKNFKTAEGVSPRMPVRNAEKIYGKVKNITRSEIESREYAEFANQPGGIDFRLSGKAGFAAVNYRTDERGVEISKHFVPSAYIFNITIAGRADDLETAANNSGETKFTSFYTDLKTDCKTQESDEGGHVSTFCKGPGNYRIHYFDTATALQFEAQTLDGEKSTRLASQSLTYPEENSKIEWRLADGKPFAVIMPVFELKRKDGLITYPAEIISEKIIIKGLDGFERIDYEEEGSVAGGLRARDLADNGYADAMIPAIRIEIPAGQNEITIENLLVKGDENVKYLLKAEKGFRMTVTITTADYAGEEGPVMYGIVTAPSGESDGQPGGRIFDSVLDETGDYEIFVSQNNAKSNATNVRFKVKVTLESANKNK